MKNVPCFTFFLLLFAALADGFSFADHNITRIRRQSCDGFRCQNGDCIPEDKECDGHVDCTDGSDETNACQNIQCPSFLFRCKYGACINPELECDGKKDCKDNSDETSPKCSNKPANKPSPTSVGSSSKCGDNQFQCISGECIHEDDKCDGVAQCKDGSDETRAACFDFQCPGYTFRCDYGACVNGNSQCNRIRECLDGSDEDPLRCGFAPTAPVITTTPPPTPAPNSPIPEGYCVLPEHPKNGKWTIYAGVTGSSYSNHQPGMGVPPGTILTVNCANKSFIVNDANSPYCNAGKWSAGLGNCVQICDPIYSTPFMKVTCTYNGYRINCSEPIEGTQAEYKCKTFYEDKQQDPYRICRDGLWNHRKPDCVPICGVKSVHAQTQIVSGADVKKGDYPWQVALYEQKSSGKSLVCGGSLINRRVIITAAHCITRGKVLKDKNLYEVAVGKYYRPYNDPRDAEHAQYKTLQSMHIPQEYKANIRNYEGDIAILVTTTPFSLSEKVQPVCMDWGLNLQLQFASNQIKGFVTGWGFTTESSNASDVLKEVQVPNVDYETCSLNLPTDYEKYLTSDKLCAGYINKGVSVCSGDSGGGLVFKNRLDGRYYLSGIVSISPTAATEQGGCNSQLYGLYTKVENYITKFIVAIELTYRA